ncbi:uncharacterized protein B0H18DRAFT_1034777 [Fomitopsis serialis]|uniref:uncharacterized protein n=1 Tax=Fomitopsis serialis TaxID=139415 RepID=UPI002007F1B3|nr:uncharacterized protein B0H18DRAFT_1034777 [Neoantrodia serialis]KAH9917455.1 hypothetical protein B0H18DRAFT_1034777 [Neoantrodia serialis]
MLPFVAVLSAIIYARHVSALTTMFIPGFDPQPVTVNLLGSQGGLTSYVIAPGASSAGMDTDDSELFGPATLVLGASTAALTYIDENIGIAAYESCQLSDGETVCEEVVIAMGADGYTTTATGTLPIESFAVQGGGPATGSNAIQTSPVPTGDFATWTGPPSASSAPSGSESSSNAVSKTSASTTATPTGNTSGALSLSLRTSGRITLSIAGLVSAFVVVA